MYVVNCSKLPINGVGGNLLTIPEGERINSVAATSETDVKDSPHFACNGFEADSDVICMETIDSIEVYSEAKERCIDAIRGNLNGTTEECLDVVTTIVAVGHVHEDCPYLFKSGCKTVVFTIHHVVILFANQLIAVCNMSGVLFS